MKRKNFMFQRSKMLTLFLLLFSLGNIFLSFPSSAEITKDKDVTQVNFESRLRFYLDLKTKRFLKKMALKEKLLLEMVEDVTSELKARGKPALLKGDTGFDLIDEKVDNILSQYNDEIKSIEKIISELETLEQTIQKIDDLKLLDEIDEIKYRLLSVLDDRKLTTSQLTKQQIADMIQEYSDEINRILKIYEQIDLFQKQANVMGDIEIVKQLDREKQRVIRILEESRIAGSSSDKLVQDYMEEAASVAEILKKMDNMVENTSTDSLLKLNIDDVREKIFNAIDARILNLFGLAQNDNFNGLTISEYFKQWKAERITEYQVKFTKYIVIRDNLIKTASSEELRGMWEREISSALLNYSHENYELAEMQFEQIYNGYKDYYTNLDGLLFFRSESNFANQYYDAARDGYLRIIQEYPNSQYIGRAYLRLMGISYTYGLHNEFFKYYKKVNDDYTIDREDLNKSHYLAGYLSIAQRNYQDAIGALENIKNNSKYYLAAQYLLGIVFTNLEKYSQAKSTFENIINQKTYPWTDLNLTIIRNESLLKLGYLHYQRSEYDKANFYFNQISMGYENYDESLLGQAWANVKTGKYDNAIDKVDILCNNYLLSNYTYEALALSAHCNRIQNRTPDALRELRYVSNAKNVLGKMNDYNEERTRILKQLDELETLEGNILEHQNKKLYPMVIKTRDLINEALTSFRYRGAMSSRVLEEYNDERKILIRQINEFETIIKFAEEQGNKAMLENAVQQRTRLIHVLEKYQIEKSTSGMSYFLDYPLAAKEGGVIYRRGIVNKLGGELIGEKQRVEKDLEVIAGLLALSSGQSKMDAVIDLEILEEDLTDLNNQLNKFQVWMANHKVDDFNSDTEFWANLSGFGMTDINYGSFRERIRQIGSYNKNLTNIESVLKEKQKELEERVKRFDTEVRKIEKEMENEKVRLEKLEKEKYFQDLYFEIKTQEIETEPDERLDEIERLFNFERGKKQ
ncbi:hypothetical protein L0Z72_03945 [candidate division KSB1 bacterium]|nr:hypothetical protein [candidate division KSB1 bacterium]